jgi:hypothetical protein
MAQKEILVAEFTTANSTKTSLLHHIMHLALGSPSRPSKIIHWMYQDQL